ncbi:hypothetical protein LCGC14_2188800 [marine sediment metagenome]|uniref:Uncharacterized protein n=1 Tax=marine sediment metagenome TaxID=412755 RepID=A0A0F9GFZ1_9ZZZZ
MSDQESMDMKIMRRMAWERAKGELQSMLQTYWGSDNFEEFDMAVKEFVNKVEDNALQE